MKMLIAEDDAIVRRLLQNYLAIWGHEVVTSQNGAEAWDRFTGEEFPMVISDWMMPQLDGVDLIRRIRARPDGDYTYIILLTARSQVEDIVEGMEAGADDFVVKPFDREELRVRIRAGERIVRAERALAEQNRPETLDPIRSALLHLIGLQRGAVSLLHQLDRYRDSLETARLPRGSSEAGSPRLASSEDLVALRAGLDHELARCADDLDRASERLSAIRPAAD